MSYLRTHSNPATPQSQPIAGQEKRQVENSAGGFVYKVDNFTRLHRFLILGSEGGSYYATEQKLTQENANGVLACIQEDGLRTVQIIREVSDAGRAPKNDPAIFALALASVHGDDATRRAAHDALVDVCRTGTHLFTFMEFRKNMGGFGRGVHRAINSWYIDQEPDDLAYQLVKYRQRGGWSHFNVLQKTKPGKENRSILTDDLIKYATKIHTHGQLADGVLEKVFERSGQIPRIIEGFEKVQGEANAKKVADLVREYRLPREALPTESLKSPDVWEALLFEGGKHGMPVGALIRNLATMTRVGLLTGTSKATQKVKEIVTSQSLLTSARVHPIQVLMALRTYAAGYSLRGSNTWTPVPAIIDALDEAFYLSFGNVESTGKRRLIALDISGSMWMGDVAGIPGFHPAEAAGAMALVSMKTGDPYEVVAFTAERYYGGYSQHDRGKAPRQVIPGLSVENFSARQRLDDVCKKMQDLSRWMGGTDCSLPMVYAKEKSKEFDIFEIYTDSETWAGGIHPSEALKQYRKASGIDAKLAVVSLMANDFSIADPQDSGMLDVVGFDTATPNLLSAFAEGQF